MTYVKGCKCFYVRNICGELINQESPNQDDLPYATATKSNTSKRQGSRSVDRKSPWVHPAFFLIPCPVNAVVPHMKSVLYPFCKHFIVNATLSISSPTYLSA
ncbi:oxalate:formate antiporter [Echinococcus multilocularis]|uniref:Oxalate:formate antiporter n=1 Tax=Echinococcus multilocularis TaxID=6211 RepID=A0A0S4MLA9_ECHMU|nr:oxalate:formate antiporter [Echinococcus multilocularis]